MKEESLLKRLQTISPADGEMMAAACAYQETLAKPPRSLGRLEDLAVQLAESGEIDALEVDSRNNKPETMDELAQLAKQYKLIRTGGSDFHGFYTSRPEPIGTCITKTEGITALFAAANNLRKE